MLSKIILVGFIFLLTACESPTLPPCKSAGLQRDRLKQNAVQVGCLAG